MSNEPQSAGLEIREALSRSTLTEMECRKNTETLLAQLFAPAELRQMIARAAYGRAEQRGFAAGQELEDWLWAEHEVKAACGLLEPSPSWGARESI